MKVVLFCGGAGMRLRGYADDIPKPMVEIGTSPLLWHLMKYYAHFGHTDFILCLGYKGNCIKDYFLHYDESVSNNFVWSKGGKNVEFLNRDIDDWTITFVETDTTSFVNSQSSGGPVSPLLPDGTYVVDVHSSAAKDGFHGPAVSDRNGHGIFVIVITFPNSK